MATVTDIHLHSRIEGNCRWEVLLDGDGIPATLADGTATAHSAGGALLTARILSVSRDESGLVRVILDKPLAIGTKVELAVELA